MVIRTQPKQLEYQTFKGIYVVQMPLLVSQGYKPSTASQIIQARLEGIASFDRYYHTVTGIAYAGEREDRFKIITSSDDLLHITSETTSETPLYDGGIRKTQEEYKSLEGKEFTRKDALFNQRLTEKEALEHELWLALADGNQQRLKEYIELVFRQVKDRYGEDKAMGIYIRDPQKVPNLRAVCLVRLDYRSDAGSGNYLGGDAQLLGVRERKSAEGTRAGKSQ